MLCVFQITESNVDFWNAIKLTWQQCSNLPMKRYVSSIAELNGKVYITVTPRYNPMMYNVHKDEWSALPELPYAKCSLVAVPHAKQLLAIGGVSSRMISNKVFVWNEDSRKWTTPYPDMPTPRYKSSSISHGSAVIVAGGVTCSNPWTLTGVVEVLYITKYSNWFSTQSYSGQWSVVEQLPCATHEAIPLIVDSNLYIAEGYDDNYESTCNIVTASLPELLRGNVKRSNVWRSMITSSAPELIQGNVKRSNVWHKLPDMPYSPWSITHYQGRLIIFNGDHKVATSKEEKWELVQQTFLYNPSTNSWDYVGDDFHGYKLGRAVHLGENKIIFIGGLTGTFMANKEDDLVETCSILTLTPK